MLNPPLTRLVTNILVHRDPWITAKAARAAQLRAGTARPIIQLTLKFSVPVTRWLLVAVRLLAALPTGLRCTFAV